jgi:hypothetical protein
MEDFEEISDKPRILRILKILAGFLRNLGT